MNIRFGYARVSTRDQTHDLQFDALTAAGYAPEHIHTDMIKGAPARHYDCSGGLPAGGKRWRQPESAVGTPPVSCLVPELQAGKAR